MKSINQQAPVKCSKSIIIDATPEKVWSVLTAISNWPAWQHQISAAALTSHLAINGTFRWKTGGASIISTLHTVEPCSKFGWTGKTFGMFAIHNWVLQSHHNKTIVLVDESMEGLLAVIFKKSFNTNLAKGMLYWLEALKTECEKAEI